MIRLVPNHAAEIKHSAKVAFTFDGRAVAAHDGETVAVALLRAGYLELRQSPVDGTPRGMFCCMGLCQECAVRVNGVVVEGCRQTVHDGLVVTSAMGQT